MIFILIALAIGLYFLGTKRAMYLAGGKVRSLHSHPFYHGTSLLAFSVIPAFVIYVLAIFAANGFISHLTAGDMQANIEFSSADELQKELIIEAAKSLVEESATAKDTQTTQQAASFYSQNQKQYWRVVYIVIALVIILGAAGFLYKQHLRMRARQISERNFRIGLLIAAGIAVMTTLGIFMSVIFESLRFFSEVPPTDFIFGLNWSPQTALRDDQVGSSGAFGAIPLFAGTAMITIIAMLVAVPVGLMSAIYLADYASPKMRAFAKPTLEFLAGVPTVVYGFFAALTVAPFIRDSAGAIGISASSESALAAGIVMGIMIIPFVSSLSDDVINAVSQSLRDGSYAMGATKSETIKKVILPAALPGIVSAILLAVSRAVGETMIVVMAAGQGANLTANPLDAVTTVTVQIVSLLTGDTEFDSTKTLSAFALGLVLFLVTLMLNIYALRVVKKYREQYD